MASEACLRRGFSGGPAPEATMNVNIAIALNLPPDVEEQLRVESGDLSTAAREAFAIELFRRGILSHCGLGQSLGIDRFETDALLKRHNVTEHALTHDDVDADVKCVDDLLARSRS
jgi:predicted HTH domain antitoxin